MSLLVRAIKTSNSGLGGGLSGAIKKAEADKALYEANMTEFDTLLTGYESDANYLGKKSKTILTEYANAFENAIDMYSADPSKENKQRVDELKHRIGEILNADVMSAAEASQLRGRIGFSNSQTFSRNAKQGTLATWSTKVSAFFYLKRR